MSRPNLAIVPLLSLISGITGCSTASVVPVVGGATSAQVTGTVTYRERVALPPNAVIKVQLLDVSRADAAAERLGEQFIEADGKQVPFSFAIAYDPTEVDERLTYAVRARIEASGLLLFTSDQIHPVITRGAPKHVDLVLKAVAR